MHEQVRQLSHQLRLFGIHASFERRCAQSEADSLHPFELLQLILEDESEYRKQMVAKRLAKRAKFRTNSDLENWDQSFDRGLSKTKFKELATLNFYHRTQNLILQGRTGEGKTHLAIALGNRLCQEGVSTRFHSTNLLFEEVKAMKLAGTYLRELQKLRKTQVLILDDFALRSYSHDEANTLLEILEERYGKGPTIITTQVGPEGWRSLFEDEVIAEAIVDRLTNPSEVLTLNGGSYRERVSEKGFASEAKKA